jgi:hypothetical protein
VAALSILSLLVAVAVVDTSLEEVALAGCLPTLAAQLYH